MADFSKFKIGNTSYNVKDAAAAKSLDQPAKGMLALKNAANQQIDYTQLKLDGSLEDVTIDPATLADGDVVTYDSATQEWVNKPASGGGSAEPVIVLADATRWPLQNMADFTSLANQRNPATLLAIRNQYEGSIVPVSAYIIAVPRGGGSYSKYSNLISLAQYEVGSQFELTVWVVEGIQSNQMHKITFIGVVNNDRTITIQNVYNLTQATLIGA